MSANLTTLWHAILAEIGKEISRPSFETWFTSVRPVSLKDQCLVVAVPNDFTREWLQDKYCAVIKKKMSELTAQNYDLQFVVSSDFIDFQESDESEAIISLSDGGVEQEPKQYPLFNPRYTFDSFVVGPCNRLSHAASLAVAKTPSKAYNPFFIYGGVGLGKTHLLHAIGQYVFKHHHYRNILYCSSEKFTNDFINAIRDNMTAEFRKKYRSMEILLIDDIQFLAGKESTQEEFFHTFNTLHNLNRQIVVSSDRPPKEIPTLEDRLRSRFEWGLITDIQSPDLETRIAILRKKALAENLDISDEVIHYIASKVENNIRELEGALIRIVAFASLANSEINLELTDEALKDILFTARKKVSLDHIIKSTAEHFNLTPSDLCGKRRTKDIALARQVAMYLARRMTEFSLPKIGEEFGRRDHTTVLYAVRKVEEMLGKDSEVRITIDLIESEINDNL